MLRWAHLGISIVLDPPYPKSIHCMHLQSTLKLFKADRRVLPPSWTAWVILCRHLETKQWWQVSQG
ncbi:hypothetical protein FA15DRAFT_756536 [Coprinopsis marcescibilis]|uniref:Uncharacterized protein n=1 Tax=Coprinopsis marcescibilis TaxID=230819 RepID=A0A5C3KW51_COPMA|nr:hypothetical protein FA15DRAFT_756536 [Coprinopsis marcescibilis]